MCSRMSGRLLLLLTMGLAIVPLNASGAGRTTGSFAVSPSGSATYSIPIWTPPGPKGVQPSISLGYSSQGGNGLAGVGWNLSAATAIERCNRTKQQDGEAGAVTLTLVDRYCLAGNRLRVVSGAYGGAGSVYHTEIADFSRITAYGSTGSPSTGPQYFIVEGKNGLTYEYGMTENSRVFPGVSPTISTTVHRWMLNKVSDRNGNNYIITYDNSNGFAVPDVISWTPAGGSTYLYEAKFNYLNNRTDTDSYFGRVAGFEVRNRRRLKDIQIKRSGVVIRKYAFGYDISGVTSRLRLTSVKECADEAEADCLLPITFSYQTGVAGVTAGAGSAPSGSSNSLIGGRFDFNGDGKDDIIYKSGTTWFVAFGANSGFAGPYSVGITGTVLPDRYLPNGRDGILTVISGNLWIYRWDDATSSFTGVNTGIASAMPALATDYTGDGLADLLYTTNQSSTISLRSNTSTGSTTPSFATSVMTNTLPSAASPFNTYWGGLMTSINFGQKRVDFNGDGRQDLYATIVTGSPHGATVSHVNILAQNGGYLSSSGSYSAIASSGFAPALNFNGDNCSDFFHLTTVLISPCKGSPASTVAAPAAAQMLLDWNGDGKTDLLVNSGGTFGVYLSTGAGFSSIITTSIPSGGGFALDQDGDGLDDIVKGNGSGALSYWTHTASGSVPAFATNIPDLLSGVTDGFGVNSTLSYVSTASTSNYDKGAETAYPLQEASTPRIVVAQVTSSNGVGGTYNRTYYYSGSREHAERREDAGFQRVEETDGRTGFITKRYFDQEFPLTGMLKEAEVFQSNGTTRISRTKVTNTHMPLEQSGTGALLRFHRYASKEVTEQYEVEGSKDGQLITTVEEKFEDVDANGNVGKVTRTVTDNDTSLSPSGQQWKTEAVNLFAQPAANCLDFITDTTVTDTAPDLTTVQRTVHHEPEGSNCRIFSTRIGSQTSLYRVENVYDYDNFGNVRLVTVTGVNPDGTPMDDRETGIVWDTYGLFPDSVINALGQTTHYDYNYDVGLQASITDPNGLVTSWEFDSFGRRESESRPGGASTSWTHADCSGAGGCVNARHKTTITRTESNGAVESAYLDQFDRTIVTRRKLMDGSFQWNETQYDALGRVLNQSIPCSSSVATLSCVTSWVTNTYDGIGRIKTSSRPINSETPATQSTTFDYAGRTTTITDPQGRTTTKIADPTGAMRVSTDANNYSQYFGYDAAGSLTAVSDSDNRSLFTATYGYGLEAFQKTAWNPEQGSRTHNYNSLGELRSWTDAAGHTFTADYDPLSRITSRTDPANGNVPAMTSIVSWGNDAAKHNIGQMESMQATVGSATYKESYVYDASGQLFQHKVTIPGDTTHTYQFEYVGGRLDTLTYPLSTGSNPLRLKYGYSNGHLQTVSDADTPSTVFWAANAQNPRGQITEETLGNGIKRTRTFDAITSWLSEIKAGPAGNLTALQNTSYAYDLVGNLTQRQNNRLFLTENFFYGDGANDRLYRLNHSTRVFNGNTTEDLRLTYDSLGNILTKTEAGTHDAPIAQAIDWTSYNYPASISATTTGETASFAYGPDRQRWKMNFNSPSGSETTYYIGGLMEKVTTGSLIDYRHYIHTGGEPIAIYSRTSTNQNNLRYLLSDHQGSIDTIAVSPSTRVLDESFTAFGLRRDASDWSGEPSNADRQLADGITRQGYTFQTVLGRMGLNHMNGRVQDAVIGRFISPDPVVSEPGYTQNFNRYAYVYNNPLTFVDPSGFECQLTNISFASSYGSLDSDEMSDMTSEWSASFRSDFSSYGACYYYTPQPYAPVTVVTGFGPTPSTDSTSAWSGLYSQAPTASTDGCDCGWDFRWMWYRFPEWNIWDICSGIERSHFCTVGIILDLWWVQATGPKDKSPPAAPSVAGHSTPADPGKNPDDNESKDVKRVSNPKHHQNSTSPEPKNVDQLYKNSIQDKTGVRWAKDADGTIHRFSRPINGETHWNGSTGGANPIEMRNIPIEIRRALRAVK